MKTNESIISLIAIATCLGSCHMSFAQHIDIQFEYENQQIELLSLPTNISEASFPTSGFFKQFADDPGFLSEIDTGQGIGSGDTVVYNVLEDLSYWNGSAFGTPTAGTQIVIDNNAGVDTVVSTNSGIQQGDTTSTINFINLADGSGDFHSHIDFTLEIDGSSDSPLFGSYGMKFSLSTDAVGVDDSDPFYIVFNFGLNETEYDTGILAYESLLIPSVLSGDFNNDGTVDAADYTVWRDNLSSPDESLINNAGDGLNGVDQEDHAIWVANYGSSTALTTALSVPEPSSLLLVLLTLISPLMIQRKL